MGNSFKVKPILNKKNGQVNVSFPKKKLPEDFLDELKKNRKVKIRLEGWE